MRRKVARQPRAGASTTRETGRSAANFGMRTKLLHNERVARTVVGRCLTPRELAVAAPAVHYAFGTAIGALYGLAVEVFAGSRRLGASAYGAGVWLVADELAMPVLGLSNPAAARTGEQHAQSLASHLVYAYTTELVRWVIRPRLPRS